ncbi:integrase core domain protein, partial [mine drainage metagenome]
MKQPDSQQTMALFRYGLIADLIHLPPGSKGIQARLNDKAQHTYTIPGSQRTRVAAETLRDWLKAYRRGGFDALLPNPRTDRGQSRTLPHAVAEVLLNLKEQRPELSIPLIIKTAQEQGTVPAELDLPRSTVHRLFSRAGLMHKDRDAPTDLDRRRFAYAHAGQMWMSDVMHGPTVLVGKGLRRKTYLIAFIDDATRV